MIQATAYLLFAGLIWLIEGFLFSQFLGFGARQTAVAVGVYAVMFGIAFSTLIRAYRVAEAAGDLSRWRYRSVAPMLVVVVGSFVSLPILLLIVVAGKAV